METEKERDLSCCEDEPQDILSDQCRTEFPSESASFTSMLVFRSSSMTASSRAYHNKNDEENDKFKMTRNDYNQIFIPFQESFQIAVSLEGRNQRKRTNY